ncbi:MAG: T9SS type A sorting domain-containing protein [Bacteroidota bacterium]
MKSLFMFLLFSMLSLSLQAQVPNAGFETWTTGNPDGWWTTNVIGVAVPIVQSSTAHSGSSAIQGTVLSVANLPYAALVQSGNSALGFPTSQRYATLTGYYRFTPVSGDRFAANVIMYKGENAVGVGAIAPATTVSSYTQFSVPIGYFTSDVPDTCVIQLTILGPTSGSDYHVGSVMLADDLVLSGTATSVMQAASGQMPEQFTLRQNYPNPFNPSTTFEFGLSQPGFTTLKVYNTLGTEIASILSENLTAGTYSTRWNASGLPSGAYFYRLQSGTLTETRTLILVK